MFVLRNVFGVRGRVLLAAGLLAVAAASCKTLDLANRQDYLGPIQVPPAAATGTGQPAAGPAKTGQPALPSSIAQPTIGQTQKAAVPETGPIRVGVTQAILMALENNQALVVERFNTPITRTYEEQARAAFDPTLTASIQRDRVQTQRPEKGPGRTSLSETDTAGIGVEEFFPTGTTVGLSAQTDISHSGTRPDRFYDTRLGLTVTQALLRGFGAQVNLASLRQARIDTLSTQYELRGFAESLIAETEITYWDYTLAQRQIEIYKQSLELAEQQLRETEERIAVGKLAQIERAAAEAEVALRREDLINATSALATRRLQLLRYLNPTSTGYWKRDVATETPPVVPEVKLDDVDEHVQVAMRMRPDLNQARLQVQRGDLQIVKTRNGLLPKLDLFATLGKTGYASSFGGTYPHLDRPGYDVLVGMSLEYPLLNRDAQAAHQRATLTRRQSAEAVGNMAQLAEVDVRSAYVEIQRAQEQVAATGVTRRLQEEKVRAETEKFRVGKSTTLLVAQAQRDLLASQISEIEAVVAYLKSFTELYRLEGSLLERRGIDAPGRQPTEMPPANRM